MTFKKLALLPFIIATPMILLAVTMTDQLYDCDYIEGENWKNVCLERESMAMIFIPSIFLVVASAFSIIVNSSLNSQAHDERITQ